MRGVVVLAGFQVDAAYAALAQPADGRLKQGVPGSVAPVVLLDEYVAHHSIGRVAVFFDIGHHKAHNVALVGKGLPYPRNRLVFQVQPDVLHPFLTGVRGRSHDETAILDGTFPHPHLDFSVGDVFRVCSQVTKEKVGQGRSVLQLCNFNLHSLSVI